MSKLQNDFTTLEQSNRLLELGVPADSANLFYSKFECEVFENRPTLCYDKKYSDIVPSGYEKNYLPCWSVGRLIEILAKCNVFGTVTIDWVQFCSEQSPLQTIYDELCAGITQGLLDFSKLEE